MSHEHWILRVYNFTSAERRIIYYLIFSSQTNGLNENKPPSFLITDRKYIVTSVLDIIYYYDVHPFSR